MVGSGFISIAGTSTDITVRLPTMITIMMEMAEYPIPLK